MTTPNLELDPIKKLTKDLKIASVTLSVPEVRYLVDSYYQIQEYRKAARNQLLALTKVENPHEAINWLGDQMETLETQIKNALDIWSSSQSLGKWCKSITGLGPVITSGLMAHIDIEKCPTAGHIWSYAAMYGPSINYEEGYIREEKDMQTIAQERYSMYVENKRRMNFAPKLTLINFVDAVKTENKLAGAKPGTVIEWNKGEKRPWNAALKTLCWKLGESFVKVCNHDKDIYGKVYSKRKELEISRNDAGIFANQAVAKLKKFKIGTTTEAYNWYAGCFKAGATAEYYSVEPEKRLAHMKTLRLNPGEGQRMLPPAHLQSRAKRKAVILFLSHYHHVAYCLFYNKLPPKPYVLEHLGHVDFIPVPNFSNKPYELNK